MNLREYLFKYEIKTNEVALATDYTRAYVTLVRKGTLKPSKKFMKRLLPWSNNEITEQEMLDYYNMKKEKKAAIGKKVIEDATVESNIDSEV